MKKNSVIMAGMMHNPFYSLLNFIRNTFAKVNERRIVHLLIAAAIIGVGISYSKLYLFHIVMLFLFLTAFFKAIPDNFSMPKLPTRLHYFYYVMFLWYLLSITWSINKVYSLEYLFYIFCGATLSLTIIYYSKGVFHQREIFKVASIVFVIEIMFSLLETFTPFRLPISPLSDYVSYFGRSGEYLSVLKMPGLIHKPTGFQWNPNNLATTMSIIFPFFLFKKEMCVRLLGSVVVLTLIVAAGSRANILAIMLMLTLFFLLYSKKRRRMFLLLLIFALALLFFRNIIKLDILGIRVFGHVRNNTSINERYKLIEHGINALFDTYGLGVGGGCSKTVQERLGGVGVKGITSMHNFWVEILVEGGVLFMLFFVYWYAKVVYSLYRISYVTENQHIRYFSSATSLSMVGFLLAAISPSSVIYLLPMWILLGFAVATINNHETLRHENTTASQP